MSSREKSSDPGIFLTAAWDEIKEIEAAYPVVWEMAIVSSFSKRTLDLLLVVRDADVLPLNRILVRNKFSWPNSTPCTFEAFLYQSCHKTARQVEAVCGEVIRYEPRRRPN